MKQYTAIALAMWMYIKYSICYVLVWIDSCDLLLQMKGHFNNAHEFVIYSGFADQINEFSNENNLTKGIIDLNIIWVLLRNHRWLSM